MLAPPRIGERFAVEAEITIDGRPRRVRGEAMLDSDERGPHFVVAATEWYSELLGQWRPFSFDEHVELARDALLDAARRPPEYDG